MKKILKLSLASLGLVSCLSLLTACGGTSQSTTQSTENTDTETKEAEKKQAISFDADSAYRFVSDQVAFGYRVPNTASHKACGDWIIKKLASWGYNTTEQSFQGTDYHDKAITGRNIIASLNPQKSERILLLAHYDTRAVADHDASIVNKTKPILGADDGASGVAVLMELARQAQKRKSTLGLDFLFVDMEDGGKGGSEEGWCQGSQYWAKTPHVAGYKPKCAILLDMVGAKDAKFCWEAYSKAYAAPYLYSIWDTAAQLGWGAYFVNKDGSGLTDDHVPIIKELKVPALDIVNYDNNRENGFGEHWHTQGDNLNIISKETLQAVGETVGTALETKLK